MSSSFVRIRLRYSPLTGHSAPTECDSMMAVFPAHLAKMRRSPSESEPNSRTPRITARMRGLALASNSLIHPLLQHSQIFFSLKESSLIWVRRCSRAPSSSRLKSVIEASGPNSVNSNLGNTCSRDGGEEVVPHARQSTLSVIVLLFECAVSKGQEPETETSSEARRRLF